MVRGDGYEGRQKANPLGSKYVSPYSRYENFAGLNVTRASQVGTGPIVIFKKIPCSAQESMKFILLINVKMPTIIDF